MIVKQRYDDVSLNRPKSKDIPQEYRGRVLELFSVWDRTRARNKKLTTYYTMKNSLKDLGISIPKNMLKMNCVVGWCKKAIDANASRAVFDGFVFEGENNKELDTIMSENRMHTKISQAIKSSLIHGISAISIMQGNTNEPRVMVRVFSANQFACLWNKDAERIGASIVLSDVDTKGIASKYVAYFDDAVLTMQRVDKTWSVEIEPNKMGRPLMELLVYDPDIDRPLGHSLLTPEILGIVDKAMRDVLRMEVGAEFFTFPQRYVLGASEDLFSTVPEGCTKCDDGSWRNEAGEEVKLIPNEQARFKAYIGALLSISRDENGDLPQVGQFSASTADNFTRVFENDAQRFSGATNVPLAQLGVLSNNYTSSDALNASNDPLVLSVEHMTRVYGEALANVGRMILAISEDKTIQELTDKQKSITVSWEDASKPTTSSIADAWTKIASIDNSIIGTRVFYEGLGFTQAQIDRLMSQKENNSAIDALNKLAEQANQKAQITTEETSDR